MMRIGQLLPADKLLPEAYVERVEVARRRPDLSMEILAVDLKKAWSGDPSQDLLLKPLDEITVRTTSSGAPRSSSADRSCGPRLHDLGRRAGSGVLERAGASPTAPSSRGPCSRGPRCARRSREQLEAFLRCRSKRMLAAASTVASGPTRRRSRRSNQQLQARREMLKVRPRRSWWGAWSCTRDSRQTEGHRKTTSCWSTATRSAFRSAPQSVLRDRRGA